MIILSNYILLYIILNNLSIQPRGMGNAPQKEVYLIPFSWIRFRIIGMSIILWRETEIYGERSSYQTQPNYYRYHLVMSSVPRETLSMQEMAGSDNNRTPVIFWVTSTVLLERFAMRQ